MLTGSKATIDMALLTGSKVTIDMALLTGNKVRIWDSKNMAGLKLEI